MKSTTVSRLQSCARVSFTEWFAFPALVGTYRPASLRRPPLLAKALPAAEMQVIALEAICGNLQKLVSLAEITSQANRARERSDLLLNPGPEGRGE